MHEETNEDEKDKLELGEKNSGYNYLEYSRYQVRPGRYIFGGEDNKYC